jgi:hypothetical protein
MGKTIAEYMKIIVTAILSVFMTLVVLSGTVIKNKADKDYVDAQDLEIKEEIKATMSDHEKIHQETKAQFMQIQNDLDIIKEHLINKKK